MGALKGRPSQCMGKCVPPHCTQTRHVEGEGMWARGGGTREEAGGGGAREVAEGGAQERWERGHRRGLGEGTQGGGQGRWHTNRRGAHKVGNMQQQGGVACKCHLRTPIVALCLCTLLACKGEGGSVDGACGNRGGGMWKWEGQHGKMLPHPTQYTKHIIYMLFYFVCIIIFTLWK